MQMLRSALLFVLGILILGIAGCTTSTPDTVFPTDTPIPPTDSPTATVDWFPATATPTHSSSFSSAASPTPISTPDYGKLIFSDSFEDPASWSLGRTGPGSIALGINELTLAVQYPNGYLYSLRNSPRLGDFYLEITASPTICRGDDEYGLLLRVSPSLDFYRFSLTCDGQTRLDKYYQGKASSPHALLSSGQVPRGAPSQTRLGVLAQGKDLSLYLNGELQYTIHDPSLASGSLGVFARAAGEDPVTVNFSDLQVYESLLP